MTLSSERLACLRVWGVLLTLSLGIIPQSSFARSLIPAGAASEWHFLTDTNSPSIHWREPGFDDSTWHTGHSPIGYGKTNLTTPLFTSTESNLLPITTWIRHEFSSPSLQPGEGLVLFLCVDDGAVLYLNGREVARPNMPAGDINPATTSLKAITGQDEGNYARIAVPMEAWHSTGTNVLAIEVHQAKAGDKDCFFDLALKTVPPAELRPKVPPSAQAAMNDYYKQHYVGPTTRIPDGYIDGGRHMQLDAEGRALSGREILLVDRQTDAELARHLAYATNLLSLTPLERTQRIAEYIDHLTTPPGGLRWVGPAVDDMTVAFANKPLRIGDVLDQGQAGVCRHRSLLFKLLADEAGLKSALVRGNYALPGGRGGAHAWNEIFLDDGRHVLVDVMHNGGKPRFPDVTNSFVVQHYLKPDNSPWYKTNAPAPVKSSR